MINERAERREQWLLVLDGCVKHHYNLAMETAPVIIGEEPSEEHMMISFLSIERGQPDESSSFRF